MTRKEQLIALRDAVRRGERDFLIPFYATLDGDERKCGQMARDAYKGSIDAARALHDALLPGWGWSVEAVSNACVWHPDTLGISRDIHISTTAARAWLLAVIEALIDQEGSH